jgi:hypothetical protein
MLSFSEFSKYWTRYKTTLHFGSAYQITAHTTHTYTLDLAFH